jgi:hypothetical protein
MPTGIDDEEGIRQSIAKPACNMAKTGPAVVVARRGATLGACTQTSRVATWPDACTLSAGNSFTAETCSTHQAHNTVGWRRTIDEDLGATTVVEFFRLHTAQRRHWRSFPGK